MKKFIDRLLSKKFFPSRLENQEGQGVVEYILLLFIVVVLVGGMLYQFHTAFGRFADNYFGEYLQCLLETGELPSLGYEGEEGICNESFQAFTFTSGRSANTGGQGGSSGSSASSGTSSGGASANGESSGRTESVSSGSGGGVDGAGSGVRSAGGSQTYIPVGRQSRSGAFSNDLRKNKIAANSGRDNNKSNSFQNLETDAYDSTSEDGLRRSYITASPTSSEEDVQGQVAGGPGSVSDNSVNQRRPAKVPVLLNSNKKTSIDEEHELEFGDFMRYLIIAAIVIALLLFFGGQAQSISKSMD